MTYITLLFSLFSLLVSADVLSEGRNCSCGFYDAQTQELFTDSIIVYFNETATLPTEFIAQQYVKKYEKTWNAIYRQGADPKNVRINGTNSLQLAVQPSTSDHLVKGGEIRTVRRDIQHGSFRTFIKSPKQTSRGSAISMMWKYNETEVSELSVMNHNDPSQAWIGTFVNGEFTTRALGMNFTDIQNGGASNRNYTTLGGGLSNGSVDPWDFTEYRIDWTKDYINFYIGGNLTRQVLHKDNKGMPSVPAAVNFKHWSTGNRYSMRGPPRKESIAEIGWIRMFFNSSSMSAEVRKDFDARCPLTETCSMDDISLRGSTPYGDQAKRRWKQNSGKDIKRMPALWISVICITFSTALVVHALARRMRQSKTSGHSHAAAATTEKQEKRESYGVSTQNTLRHSSNTTGSYPILAIPGYGYQSKDDLTIEKAVPSPGTSVWGGSTHGGPSRPSSIRFDSRAPTPRIMSPTGSTLNTTTDALPLPKIPPQFDQANSLGRSQTTIVPEQAPERPEKIAMETVTESAMPAPRMRPQPPPPRQRIDYLAGLVALCALLVTVMHFGLTFVPAIVIPGAPQHHPSEWWAQQIVAPFILNQMWLGVFFTTSVRFLVAPYLKKGNMQDVAKAAVRRTPRLMIPVGSIALLEYFLIDCGATYYLSYIPSLTWSTWPYVTRYESFGHYISAILELVYLVPNAVPQITFNYCTGVLWTIAVQLQGTWLVLLGVIIVYEVKTTWKRVCYYIFCMINHWYASSWGTYLWLGLLLTDLDITYKYKKWLHDRPAAYYPLIMVCWLCVALGFSANVISGWVDFNFATLEHGIHPDITTGEATMDTERAGYPPYYSPRLNGLLFAGGMQAVLELSPAVQWFFSLPPLLVLFPHIFTIYLIHGLIFWSWGSWIMVVIANHNIPYGINVTIVGITSYILLFASLPIITPIIEALGKDITALVWTTAIEKSPPRRKTMFPFPDDLFLKREANGNQNANAPADVEARGGSSCSGSSGLSEKGKMKAEQAEVDEINQYENKGKNKEMKSF